jgi:hypothetical protein
MAVRVFLRCLDIGFAESEILSEERDPPDVVFRDAQFEVMEVLAGRKRGDEWREREERWGRAKQLSDVGEPYTPFEPMPMAVASQMCVEGLAEKAEIWTGALCAA